MLRNCAGISSNYARNSRILFSTGWPNRETRKACSGTFAKLAPQHGHAFLDAISMHTCICPPQPPTPAEASQAKPSQTMLPTPPVKSPCISTRLLNAYGNMY